MAEQARRAVPRARSLRLLLLAQPSCAALLAANHWPALRELRGDESHDHGEALEILAGQPRAPLFVFPPLYSRFLALLYAVFGSHRLVVELAQSGLLLGGALLLRILLRRAGFPGTVAGSAAVLLLIDPQVSAFAGYLWPEVLHLLLMLVVVFLMTADERPSAT